MAIALPVTRGLVALIDEADEGWAQFNWFAKPRDQSCGGFYVYRTLNGLCRSTLYLHRAILDARPGEIVDHIDGDGLNNQRSNLRIATPSQNCANRGGYKPASGYRGVYAAGRQWVAQISVNGEMVKLGRFAEPASAAAAYDAAAQAQFGQFARLNFPLKAA